MILRKILTVYISYLRASVVFFLVLSVMTGQPGGHSRLVELSEEGSTSFATKLPVDGILVELRIIYCHRPFYLDIWIVLPPL